MTIAFGIPVIETLVGLHVYAQGAILDPTYGGGGGAGLGVTVGLKILIGE